MKRKASSRDSPVEESPMIVDVNIDNRKYRHDLDKDLDFGNDLDALNQSLIDQPKRYAWWAMLESAASLKVKELQEKLEDLEAELYIKVEKGLTMKSAENKKPTVGRIEAEVRRRPEIKEMKDEIREARRIAGKVASGKSSVQMRKDCLIETARNIRSEMEHGLSVRSKNKEHRVEQTKQRFRKMFRKEERN